DHEIADLERLLRGARLLTVLGPGGAGKTRLALELAGRLRAQFPDGVWLVELGFLTSGALLAQSVATTLQVREQRGQVVLETLGGALATRSLLLVLDNCEHLVEASAHLAEALLRRCPGLTVLT